MKRDELLAALGPALDAALELEPEARGRWLAELRLSQPGLAAELQALLESEASLDANAFLARPQSMPQADELAGLQVGAYTLVRALGRGGMGTVWLAQRSDGRFEGAVALKLLQLALLDPIAVERFRREGQALARLQHPGIARLLDAGITGAGVPYLVLELAEGARIDAHCEAQRLSPRNRIDLVRQVASAVAHAHANLIIHRDLKPSNILVADDGTIKLLDFGIAKLIEADAPDGEVTELTALGGTPFTPEYAAPEQIAGQPTTTATDVYALGVLLYRLLSGRHPTAAGSHNSADYLRTAIDTEPKPLSVAAAVGASDSLGAPRVQLRRLYAGDLDNILARALEKDPARRYGTVNEFADDLGRYLRNEPVQARPASLGYRARKFVRRNRVGVASAAVATTLLVASTVVALGQAAEARRQRDAAGAERDRAVLEERRAMASNSFLQTLLGTVGTASKPLTTAQLLEQARALLERDFAADPGFVARTLLDLSAQYGQFAQETETRKLLDRAGVLAARSGDPETVALVECAVARRDARMSGANPLEHLRKGREALAVVSEHDYEAKLACLLADAWIAHEVQQQDRAVRQARAAMALAVSAGDTASLRFVDVLTTLESTLQAPGRIRERLEAARRLARAYVGIGRGNTVGMVNALWQQAHSLLMLGEYRAADSAFAALRPVVAQVAPEFLDNYILIHVATLADILGRPDTAIAIYTAHLNDARAQKQRDRERWVYLQLVGALVSTGRLDDAERMLTAGERIGQPDLSSLTRRTELVFARGYPDSAKRMYRDALATLGFPSRPIPVSAFRILARAADAALRAGDHAAADSVTHYALQRLSAMGHDPVRSGEMGIIMLILARSRLGAGDPASAAVWARRSLPPLTSGLGSRHRYTLEAEQLVARIQAGGQGLQTVPAAAGRTTRLHPKG